MSTSHARGDVGRAPLISMPLDPLSTTARVGMHVCLPGLHSHKTSIGQGQATDGWLCARHKPVQAMANMASLQWPGSSTKRRKPVAVVDLVCTYSRRTGVRSTSHDWGHACRRMASPYHCIFRAWLACITRARATQRLPTLLDYWYLIT